MSFLFFFVIKWVRIFLFTIMDIKNIIRIAKICKFKFLWMRNGIFSRSPLSNCCQEDIFLTVFPNLAPPSIIWTFSIHCLEQLPMVWKLSFYSSKLIFSHLMRIYFQVENLFFKLFYSNIRTLLQWCYQ